MKKNFKRDLTIKSSIILFISLVLCTFVFIYLHINYMSKTNTRYLQQTSMDSEELIVHAIDSVKSSTDLLANTLGTLNNIEDQNKEKTIENLVCNNTFIKRAFITKADGMQIAKYPNIGNVSIANRNYFKKAIQGQGNFSPVIISTITGEAIIIYCTPIKIQGNIIGTLSSILEIDSLSSSLNLTTKNLNCTFGLLDNHGALLLTNKKDSLLIDKLNDKSSTLSQLKKIINLSNLEPVQKMINNESGSGKFILNNTKALTSYTSLKDYGLNLLIAVPYSSITNSIYTYSLIALAILIFIMILSLIFIKNFTDRITNPITNLSITLKKFSEGNLNFIIDKTLLKRNDEFSQLSKSFNVFSERIKTIIKNFKKNAINLNTYSNNLKETIQDNKTNQLDITNMINDVNTKMNENLVSLEENLNILKQFSEGIDNVNLNLENLHSAVNASTSSAQKGAHHASNMEYTLNESFNSLKNINVKINNLTNLSSKINSLLDVITSIAKETNLLSLNASIEAARAGEYGKSFTIVAEKIKKLAEESSKASKNIDNLLYNIQHEILSTSNILDDMNNKFKNLVTNIKLTTTLMNDIKDKAFNSQLSVEEIISIIENQSTGIENSTESLTKVVHYINDTMNSSKCINKKLDVQSEKLNLLSSISFSLNDISEAIKNDLDYFH
ncbi:HAMP domain-containing protein [Clostridium botulinum C]|uniref:HAMP domain-containing protein n=2 Tax=Clostridium botulinum TaxID=1491 RepID=A0A9Q4TMB7_CLOBO|nr:methyl-accepting chemotaxis protein [Clostridium botulinum]MCD3195132.1 HAMP domain-containing protein [Clostridium botulinum C]MCD3200472.1 HAMP domain-containing protein [Clostridium botulinum C]MCD3205890.1 HAMP domain-containing protein [Clostridium botulinum C]MCD3209236.1 HAMP domain-containing protein [Clostridium botulinum C]MCD3224302.1 HAMP domain-containing protein [Clostridium botulinum C]